MIQTEFASAERSPDRVILEQYEKFSGYPVLNSLLGKVDKYIFVLNENRQVIYCNTSFIEDFGVGEIYDVLGKRVGEILDCRFAWSNCGCGTSFFCRECAAAQSIMYTQSELADSSRECIIITNNSKTIEVGVTSKDLEIDGEHFVLFAFADISNDKKLKELEDLFFHDLVSLVTGMHSMLQLLNDSRLSDKNKIMDQLNRTSEELMNELSAHIVLKSAERNDLKVNKTRHNSLKLIEKSVSFVENLNAAKGNILYIHHTSSDFDLITDSELFNRVLVNMLVNALEASAFSQRVTAGCEMMDGKCSFWVHNHSYMPPEIQSQIFRKKFTTKRRGSGYGTHSIRRLTEGYLGGYATFESDENIGTYFRIFLPV